jgi:hypothetical protein
MQRLRRIVLSWFVLSALVSVYIVPSSVSADAVSDWTPGPGAVSDNTYAGFIDAPSGNASVATGDFSVAGWFVDRTAQGWAGADEVQVWLGTMDGGGRMLTQALFAQSRPDVAGATGNPYWASSGFGAVIPSGALPTGSQLLSVYAHTPAKGWWYKQVPVNVSSTVAGAPSAPGPTVSGGAVPVIAFEKPKDGENVLTKSDYEIAGYALDRAASLNQGVAGSGIDRVQIYIGAERDNGGTFLGDAELGFSNSVASGLYGSQFASSGWRLTFKPTNFKANTYVLYAYAHSVVTGKEDWVTKFFAIKEPT